MLALVSVLLATHPTLWFNAADVPALRSAAQTTHAEIASHITAVLDAHLSDPAPTPTQYGDFRLTANLPLIWAFGYQMTGNTAYADKARDQLLTFLSWTDWSYGEGIPPDLNEAHMLISVSAAYDWLYERLSAADRASIATRLGTEADKVAVNLPNAWYIDEYVQGHNWIDTAGLGLAALALMGEDGRAAGWLSLAEGNLQKLKVTMGQIPDGTWHEGLPYQGYDLGMSLPFWTALARTGADYTDIGILRGYGKYLLYAGIPDAPQQAILPFGDFTNWLKESTLQISRYGAARFRDPVAETAARRYLQSVKRGGYLPELIYNVFEFIYYDASIGPMDPRTLPLDGVFPDIGAATMHSTWDPGDFTLGFKASVFGGNANFARLKQQGSPAGGWIDWGHDHNDDMSFWLYGKGAWLAPEAMGYDAGKSINYTYPANQTAYHNALLVDGQGQLGDVRASDSNWNNPWFFNRTSGLITTPVGTADYAVAAGQGAGLFDASLGISRWDRMAILARNRYALIRDDIEASSAHAYDWICHFQDGASVDGSGWVQGIGKNGMSLGVRMVAPAQWTATTGAQTAELMMNFDPDASTSWVRVRPAANVASTQFLAALVPVATASWASRTPVNPLDSAQAGAGIVIAPGSALEERWIFSRAGQSQAAGDLALSGSYAGMAARDASGAPLRAVLFGAGSISDQGGGRLLLSSASARAIQATLAGSVLAMTGDGVADFQVYAPAATSVTLNGAQVAASFESGMVTYPVRGGGVPPDAGTPDAGTPDAGPPDAGCGNCMPPAADGGDGGPAGTTDAGSSADPDGGANSGSQAGNSVTLATGCSQAGAELGWLAMIAGLAFVLRRRR